MSTDALFDRTPPHDDGAERAVLGAILLAPDAVAEVVGRLQPGDFYRPVHRAMYEAVLALYSKGEPVDPVTVLSALARSGGIQDPASFLHGLVENGPVTANIGYYAGLVAEAGVGRRVIEAGTRIVQWGYARDADDVLDRAESELAGVSRAKPEECVPLGDILGPTLDEIERAESGGGAQGVPTGFVDLDRLLHGLHAGQLVMVAGRPGCGKSLLCTDILRAASIKHNLPTVLFSLEMSRTEIGARILAAEARVNLHDIRGGTIGSPGWEKVSHATGRMAAAPLYVDDSTDLSMAAIRAKACRLKQRHGLRLIVVDYLQLMSSPERSENRQQEVSALARSLKLLAKDLDVPILVASQLNRGPESRQDKRPLLSDLRESGSLEQDSDVVILIYRPDLHESDSQRVGEADFIVAKHRNGPTATITVAFQGQHARFVDLATF